MIRLSHDIYAEFKRKNESNRMSPIRDLLATNNQFYGMQVEPSNMFPMITPCAECRGTGEGSESTYCKKCDGAGQTKIDGMVVQNSFGSKTPMLLIRDSLPKAFQPRFPVPVAAPAVCKGLH